jgi:antitoxin YefM
MEVVTMSEARNNLKEIFEKVYFNHDEIIIHRKGKESVVMISLDEYNSLKETEYLMKNQANREWIKKSINSAKSGKKIYKEI